QYAVLRKNRELSARIENLTHYGELTGQSEVMREVYKIIEAVAASTASVLILGESGTGKELVARAIHQKSERVRGPFFALNCAALPKEILENELFGHEKGAFTGSTNEKQGAFELASGGTLFFDEVAEMSPDIQVKLLRALETRAVRRLGGKKEIPVDIRVVAATNRDVQKAVAEGDLREDLYYRLAVVDISLPPLRERANDIHLLADEFLERFATQNGKQVAAIEDAAWDWILSYHWPGNVRELKNAIERAVIMSRAPKITLADIMPRHLRTGGDTPSAVSIPIGSTAADARRQVVLRTFASTGGDAARTARILGVATADVHTELLALLNGVAAVATPAAAAGNGAGDVDKRAARRVETPATPSRAQAKGKAGKKAR
ncbi:MAG TPA: sigma-54 dependent transcriptional regulator, partial [Thermoanaerobaculia bacterium]|nr:sigma-54 dependent transcriptional regulator [Thermoanaerobaculia bacterium]